MVKIIKIVFPYILCGVLAILLYQKWDNKVIVNHPGIMATVAKAAKQYQDNEGRKHIAIAKNANAIKPKDFENVSPGYVDTAVKALKIAKTEIDQITKLLLISEGQRLLAEKVIDSMGVASYSHNGKHLTINLKNGYFSYKYHTGLVMVDYTKKTKFLGITLSRKSFTDFALADTAAYFTDNIQRITVDRYEAKPWLKFNAGAQYNVQNRLYGYGPGLQIEKGPLDLSLRQIYWPAQESWSTIISARLTLKSF